MTAVAMRTGPAEGMFERRGSVSPKATRPPPSLPECTDLQSTLFAAQASMKNARSKTALMSADGAQLSRDQAIDQARAAVAKAQQEMEDAKEKGELISTLRTVATVAVIVVAAASVVCSAGISTPGAIALVGVALSVSSPYVADATGSEKLGLAVALLGAAMSLGAGAYSAFAGAATTTMTAAQQATIAAAKATAATAEIGAGVNTIQKGNAEARAQDSRADAANSRAKSQEQQAIVDDAIELLNEVETKSRRAIASILAIGQSESSSRMNVIANVRRV